MRRCWERWNEYKQRAGGASDSYWARRIPLPDGVELQERPVTCMLTVSWSHLNDVMETVLKPDTSMVDMIMLVGFSWLIWALPQWINCMPFSRDSHTSELQMCQLPGARVPRSRARAPNRDQPPLNEWRDCDIDLPRMPHCSCLIVHHRIHFCLLAMDYEESPGHPDGRPIHLDSLSRLPFLDTSRMEVFGPRTQRQAGHIFGMEDVDFQFHVGQEPAYAEKITMLCGAYVAAMMYDIMVKGKTVRQVRETQYNSWCLRAWLVTCLERMELQPPPYL